MFASSVAMDKARAGFNASSEIPLYGNSTPNQQQFALLDMFIPGFSTLSSALYEYLGIDITLYIHIVLGVFTVAWSSSYIYGYVRELVEAHLMSSVCIRTDDEIFDMLMSWVALQPFSQRSRRFIAKTGIDAWRIWMEGSGDDSDEEEEERIRVGDTTRTIHYTPSYGKHMFFFRGHPIIFERRENRDQMGSLMINEREEIYMSCLGRSPRVIKEILLLARRYSVAKDKDRTVIYRGEQSSWSRCMSRSTRPFSTVILDEQVKKRLIDDVSDYLHPATRRWYANRGIPYRRGYLLHGPPGTGKSSLSLALAGYFRLRIYILSLNSPTATEENVASLFARLPRQCVVLLEDIDSAGLSQSRDNDPPSPVQPIQQPARKPNGARTQPESARITLSGLLNVLDGVASQEGRVLIMTTNHKEKLDQALIRPGRIDMTVEFGYADADMTAFIYRAMYSPQESDGVPTRLGGHGDAGKSREYRAMESERVDKLSKEFAAKVPELEFSPAEIQGLLLQHKTQPSAVIDAVDGWIENTRKDKEEKRKAMEEDMKRKAKEEEERKRKTKDEEENKEKANGEEDTKEKAEDEKDKKDKSTTGTVSEGVVANGKKQDAKEDLAVKEPIVNGEQKGDGFVSDTDTDSGKSS